MCPKSVNQKSQPQVQIRLSLYTYMPTVSPSNYKALSRAPSTEKKKSKIAPVPTACSFGGTIFGGWWIDSASKGKCCLHSCNFGFFVMSSTPEVVKTHLSSGHEPQGTIDTLEVCFYHKPSLILMRFIKM